MDVQNSKGDTDVKGRLLDSVEEGEGSKTWENITEMSTLPHVKEMTSPSSIQEAGAQGGCLWQPGGMRSGGRRVGASGWGNTCIPTADSC